MPNRLKKGFTLIELLIAIFVLAVGIVAVLEMFPLGTYVQKSAQMGTLASELCQEKMEEIISESYNNILPGVNEEPYGFNSSLPSFKRKTEVNYFDPNNPQVPPDQDLGIKKIEVTVFWKSPLGINEKEIKLATLISKR